MSAYAGSEQPPARQTLRLFLCGDVMTGRGIDQALPHPCDPALHEDYVRSADEYVRIAEAANGPIARPLAPAAIWGAAQDEWNRVKPDLRIVNLETSITRSEDYEPKGINYRMSPENAEVLTAAGIDCCVLANNHVLDWGRQGLLDTLATLQRLGIKTAGAGRNRDEAAAPSLLPVPGKGRVLVYSFASETSGAPRGWAPTADKPGVNLLSDMSPQSAERVAAHIAQDKQPGDVVVVSLHWGPNWGYDIPDAQQRFAHALIDGASVSVVHGHSSHHAKAIEVYRNRLILYGCGDFLDDYEGITGYEDFRDDLAVMYFADIAPESGELIALEMVPLQIRNFRLVHATAADVAWMRRTLDRESRRFCASVAGTPHGSLTLSATTESQQ